MLHSYDYDDECCTAGLDKAAAGGYLDTSDTWTCGRCGCMYKAVTMIGEVKRWEAVQLMKVFRP